MKLGLVCALGIAVALPLFQPSTARADDELPPPDVTHTRSSGAYAGGIALTTVGGIFLTSGLAFGASTIWAIDSISSAGDGGSAALGGVAIFGLAAAISTVVGLATFIPGVVMVVKNHPTRRDIAALPAPVRPVALGAHERVPSPRFYGVPILAGQF
jgi:hypothetical protein